MARSETILRVLVSSPGDVAGDRNKLEEVVSELNLTWRKRLGISFELVRWETHAFPGVGADAQDVINVQFEDDYDIFIGLFWTRFGTPTGRAGSGTEEEFNRAYDRYCHEPTKLRVMFYFKDSPPTKLSDINLTQYALVKDFQDKLKKKGVLYWSYDTEENLAALLRIHLSNQVQEWGKSWGGSSHPGPAGPIATDDKGPEKTGQPPLPVSEEEEEEELGFLEQIARGEEEGKNLFGIMQRMTRALTRLTEKMELRTAAVTSAQAGIPNLKKARRAANLAASDMEQFVTSTKVEMPAFAEAYRAIVDAFSHAASLLPEFGQTGKEQLVQSEGVIGALEQTILETMVHMREFRKSVEVLPRVTTAFGRAKKHTVEVLNELLEEMDKAASLAREVRKSLGGIQEAGETPREIEH